MTTTFILHIFSEDKDLELRYSTLKDALDALKIFEKQNNVRICDSIIERL